MRSIALVDTIHTPILRQLFASPSDLGVGPPLEEYTLGPAIAELRDGADAFLMVRGSTLIPSKGRAREEISDMVVLGVLAGLGGFYRNVYEGDLGSAPVSAALADDRRAAVV